MLPALLTMWAFTTAHWLASVIVAFNVYQSLRGHTLEMVAWAQDAVACSSSGFSSSGNASHIATAACSIEVVGRSLPSFNRGTLAPRECAGTVAIAFNVRAPSVECETIRVLMLFPTPTIGRARGFYRMVACMGNLAGEADHSLGRGRSGPGYLR